MPERVLTSPTSDAYHRPECRFPAEETAEETTVGDAIKRGKDRCRLCFDVGDIHLALDRADPDADIGEVLASAGVSDR